MKIFGTKKEPVAGSKIPRVSKMSDTELMSWFNSTVMNVGINFDMWRYHDAPLEELEMSVDSLTEIWNEIKARKNGRDGT